MSRTKHGMTGTPEYKTWQRMKYRCYNLRSIGYKDYGGRGIRVCDKWLNDFMAFYKDMGVKPSPEHSIDRIDNDGNYEPANCRWADNKTQNINRRPPKRRMGYRQKKLRNKTGYVGVYKQGNRWRAGINISLGVFDTPQEAAQAYYKARAKLDAP